MVVLAVAYGTRAQAPLFPRRRRDNVGAVKKPGLTGWNRDVLGYARLTVARGTRAQGTRVRVRLAASADGSNDRLDAPHTSSAPKWTNSKENLLAQLSDAGSGKKKKKKKNKEGDKGKKKIEEAKVDEMSDETLDTPQDAASEMAARIEEKTKQKIPLTVEEKRWAHYNTPNPYITPKLQKRTPWSNYPWGRPGVAGGKPKEIDELKWSPNGNAYLQLDRQTIPYNQFCKGTVLSPENPARLVLRASCTTWFAFPYVL